MKLVFSSAAVFSPTLAISACKQESGAYHSYLILRGEGDKSRMFFLGGYTSYRECAEQGVYETANYESEQNIFWTNSDFSYGGYKGSDDWDLNVIEGFVCEHDAQKMSEDHEESTN